MATTNEILQAYILKYYPSFDAEIYNGQFNTSFQIRKSTDLNLYVGSQFKLSRATNKLQYYFRGITSTYMAEPYGVMNYMLDLRLNDPNMFGLLDEWMVKPFIAVLRDDLASTSQFRVYQLAISITGKEKLRPYEIPNIRKVMCGEPIMKR